MTPSQVELVQSSFKAVSGNLEQVAAIFYDRLFSIDPSLQPMFKGDIREQGRKLTAALAVAVNNLKNPAAIAPALQEMGKRHRSYGVKDKDYDTVAAALLWTLEKGLGSGFTEDCRDAWVAAYTLVADAMKQPAAAA